MNYVILAAGEGSRLGHEGIASAKPLVEIGGEPLIARLVRIFADNGAERIAIISRQERPEVAEHIRLHVAPLYSFPIDVISRNTAGSMHSFAEVASLIPAGKFIMTTVDTIFRPEYFSRYVATFIALPDKTDTGHPTGLMGVTRYIDDEKPLYVLTGADDGITGFSDTAACGARFISAGIYGLQMPAAGTVLNACMQSGQTRMRQFQRALLTNNFRLRAFDMGKVIDIDHASDIAKAEELLNAL